jgi:hypothetical protein
MTVQVILYTEAQSLLMHKLCLPSRLMFHLWSHILNSACAAVKHTDCLSCIQTYFHLGSGYPSILPSSSSSNRPSHGLILRLWGLFYGVFHLSGFGLAILMITEIAIWVSWGMYHHKWPSHSSPSWNRKYQTMSSICDKDNENISKILQKGVWS